LTAIGDPTDVNAISMVYTNGLVTVSNVNNCRLLSLSIHLAANANSTTVFTVSYPEPNGGTTAETTAYPFMFFNNTAGGLQPIAGFTATNSAGVVSIQKTGLVANTSYIFRVQF